ncbi:MAG TPA: FAD-dependent oxidoreductase [Xanthobacteraceae bacterium]|nr:FAD-dependent oxidoreductase [Xanthobacteraceae bacterium]
MIHQAGAGEALDIAVIGSGISGMAAAWLLSQRHRVTVYEREVRPGGHSHTVSVDVGGTRTAVDTGFIVYNEATYPNLTALFEHLGVATQPSDMSFSVSLDGGALEYAGTDLRGLFAQRSNLFNPRFWSMLRDLLRFYREAPAHAGKLGLASLGDYLAREGYGRAFRDDHLLPMAAAIWSAPAQALLDYPAEAFIRFCDNHGLLKLVGRPVWRTVSGGSRLYVDRLTALYADRIRLGRPALAIARTADGVRVRDAAGGNERFDHVVVATHADEALGLLDDADARERALLGAFRYTRNLAVLHTDASLMPKRRGVWASWNYLGRRESASDSPALCVSYWMNRLQGLTTPVPLFVTLNPVRPPDPKTVLNIDSYEHPIFGGPALTAQRRLWSLQGVRNTWFCGAYFGAGFHEDGLQSGLAVAEALGGVRRPWTVENESGRIVIGTREPQILADQAA